MQATTSGPAYRVTVVGPQHTEAYEGVQALVDADRGVVHVFGADGATHYLTIPLTSALIEWHDPTPLQPQPRFPPYGTGAFERLGEHVQRMAEGIGRDDRDAQPRAGVGRAGRGPGEP